MSKKDPRIDAYIQKAQPFAQPILEHLRALVHQAIPDIEENIKWGMPSFEYKGNLCGIASFKQHVTLGFFKAKLIKDPTNYLGTGVSEGGAAMGNLGRIANLKDLPPDKVLIDFFKQAKKLNQDGIKLPPKENKPVEEIAPEDFAKALKKNKKAFDVFEKFPPSAKKDYIQWITEAKTEATRNKRMETALEWISEGKKRNWKYETQKS